MGLPDRKRCACTATDGVCICAMREGADEARSLEASSVEAKVSQPRRMHAAPSLQARGAAESIIASVALMAGSGLPCYGRGKPLQNLRARFNLEMSDAQAAAFMRATVADAYDKARSPSWLWYVWRCFHPGHALHVMPPLHGADAGPAARSGQRALTTTSSICSRRFPSDRAWVLSSIATRIGFHGTYRAVSCPCCCRDSGRSLADLMPMGMQLWGCCQRAYTILIWASSVRANMRKLIEITQYLARTAPLAKK